MSTIRRNLPSLCLLAAMILLGWILGDSLPDRLPSRYGLDGSVVGTMSRGRFLVLLPGVFGFVMILVNVMIRISPQKFSMPHSKRAMDVILFGVGVLLFCIYLGSMLDALGLARNGLLAVYGVAAVFIITGNVFGKTERNFFMGLRLPWTLNSSANWKATHRLAGKLMVVSGILLALINTLVPVGAYLLLFVLAPLLLPMLYSPYYYFRYEKPAESEAE